MIGAVRRGRLVTVSILLGYALAVASITVVPSHRRGPDYWREPWWTMLQWVPFRVEPWSFALNVVMFMPFGVLVPLLWRSADSFRRLAGWAFAASAAIETIQFVFNVTLGSRRTVDVNDLIANTGGALLGLLVLRLARPRPVPRDPVTASDAGTPRSP
jgi:glycopeptide antibiotics resistance protein